MFWSGPYNTAAPVLQEPVVPRLNSAIHRIQIFWSFSLVTHTDAPFFDLIRNMTAGLGLELKNGTFVCETAVKLSTVVSYIILTSSVKKL